LIELGTLASMACQTRRVVESMVEGSTAREITAPSSALVRAGSSCAGRLCINVIAWRRLAKSAACWASLTANRLASDSVRINPQAIG